MKNNIFKGGKTAFLNYLLPLIGCLYAGFLWGLSDKETDLYPVLLVPFLWCFSKNRLIGGASLALYALFGVRGFIEGSAIYFGISKIAGLGILVLSAVPWFFLGFICHFKSVLKRVLIGMPLWLILLCLPPFMLVGWTNPLIATGLLFPANPVVSEYKNIQAHNTHFKIGDPTKTFSIPEMLEKHFSLSKQLSDKEIEVFPESVGDFMDSFLTNFWQLALEKTPEKIVLIGGFDMVNDQPQAVMYAITHDKKEVIYRQRTPMTGGMYNPLKKDTFPSNWFGTPVANIQGKKIGFAICFEYVTMYPVIQMLLAAPDLIITPTSIWWSPKQLQNAQIQSLKLSARIWQKPVILALNN